MADEIIKDTQPEKKEEAIKETYTKAEVDELLKGRFEQKDVDKIVTERIAREKKAAEKDKSEALRLATLTAEEKAAEMTRMKEETLTAKEKELAKKELLIEISEQLKAEGLPAKMAKNLIGETTEETAQNIKDFKKEWQEQLQNETKKKLGGNTPASTSTQTEVEMQLNKLRKAAGLI